MSGCRTAAPAGVTYSAYLSGCGSRKAAASGVGQRDKRSNCRQFSW